MTYFMSNISIPTPNWNISVHPQPNICWPPDLGRIAYITGLNAAIIPMAAPEPNSSFSLSFYGPAIKCTRANITLTAALSAAKEPVYNESLWNRYSYIAFAPNSGNLTKDLLTATLDDDRIRDEPASIPLLPEDTARIIFLTASLNSSHLPIGWEVSQCHMFNASYNVSFQYVNNILLQMDVKQHNLNYIGERARIGPTRNQPMCNYEGIMSGFIDLLFGSIPFRFSRNRSAPYKGIMLSSAHMTKVHATALVNTPEMLPRYDYNRNGSDIYPQTNTGLSKYQLVRNLTLAVAAEELFRNVTISLLAGPLKMNSLEATTPTAVKIQRWENVYVYRPLYLFVSYGLAMGFSVLATACGFLALFANRASYWPSFSTIFRISRNSELLYTMQEKDNAGHQPQPKKLARTEVRLSSQQDAGGQAYTSLVIQGRHSSGTTEIVRRGGI